ncbi:hypothetical protein, partial [Streptomyces sp. NPDC058066]|uniref:hypothetical protein n=1 Tax=Streptomyces sp. NPDC058066 TaxID=3346323 RepID=UPI0036EB3DFB
MVEMFSNDAQRQRTKRASGLSAAATIAMSGILLGGGGTALASAVPATASNTLLTPDIHQYVVQQPPNPNSRQAGYQLGKELGKEQAIADYKHGQTSRQFVVRVRGNSPHYSYAVGMRDGQREGYTQQMNLEIGTKYGSMMPAIPSTPKGPNAKVILPPTYLTPPEETPSKQSPSEGGQQSGAG